MGPANLTGKVPGQKRGEVDAEKKRGGEAGGSKGKV